MFILVITIVRRNGLVITQSYLSIQKQLPEVFCKKKRVLKNFANFTDKHLCWGLFWQKQPLVVFCRKGALIIFSNFTGNTCVGVSSIKFIKNFIKKRLQHRCFPVKFAKYLKTPISKNINERLLLSIDLVPKGCIFCEILLYCIRLG